MDEELRILQRQAQSGDPASQARYAALLIRIGAIEDCVDKLCNVGKYYDYIESFGSPKEKATVIDQRRELLTSIVECISPVKVYIVMQENPEGDFHPQGVFTTRGSAEKEIAERIMTTLDHWYNRGLGIGAELIDDLQLLYNNNDYQGIIGQARGEGIFYHITESSLFG